MLRTLDELSLTENTLVIFTSDNGSTPKDFKGTQGVRLNLADDSGDIRRKFKTAKEDAKKLGHVTNGPWRDGKGYAYEGGHRVPFIVRWPGQIAAGTSSECTTSLTDLFATAADIVDRDLPSEVAEDSFSLLPVLLGKEKQIAGRESVFILGNGKDSAVAVCTGKWKLIVRYGSDQIEAMSFTTCQRIRENSKTSPTSIPKSRIDWLQHFRRPKPPGEPVADNLVRHVDSFRLLR